MTFGESCEKAMKDGMCKNDCCGFVPIKKAIIKEYKHKIQVKYEVAEGMTEDYLLTKDMFCAFLDRKEKKCLIYEQRPMVCRLYGVSKDKRLSCPHFKPNGNPWSPAMKKRVDRMIKKMTGELIKKANDWEKEK